MVTDVQLPGERNRPTIFSAHHIESLELDTQDYGRPLDLVLLGSRYLLQTLLTLIHGLPLAQVLPSEVAAECRLDIIGLSTVSWSVNIIRQIIYRLPDVQEKIHEMLKGCGDVLTAETHNVLPHVTSEHLIKRSRLLGLVVNGLWDFSGD